MNEESFKQAMSRLAAGVTIVTTADPQREPWGFTASSVTSLSLDPPLIIACLARSADCAPVFEQSTGFAVNILGPQDTEVALRFATKGATKFSSGEFEPGRLGHPLLKTAIASVECELEARYPGGDHAILVGRVVESQATHDEPVVYFDRGFRYLGAPVAAD